MKRKPPKPPSRSRYPDDRYSDDYSDRSDSYFSSALPPPQIWAASPLATTSIAVLLTPKFVSSVEPVRSPLIYVPL